MPKMFIIDRDGGQHEFDLEPGESIYEPLRELDSGVEALCGGMCSCATCHVWVDEEWLDRFPSKDVDEEELLEFLDHFKANSRLSCQLILQPQHNGLRVTLAPEE